MVHDHTAAEEWYKSLKNVAETFNLNTIALDKAATENNYL